MDDHPRGLVDDEDVVVLESDVERDVLPRDLARRRWWLPYRDLLALARAVAGLLATAVDEHVTVGDQCRGVIAGDVEAQREQDVEAGCVDGSRKAFTHLSREAGACSRELNRASSRLPAPGSQLRHGSRLDLPAAAPTP